jgi:hypothetical protein
MAWFPSRQLLLWRLRVEQRGDYEVGVRLGGTVYGKSLSASPRLERRSPVRHAGAFGDQVLLPAEAPLPRGAPVTRIEIRYPDTGITWDIANRVWLMFLVSIVFAFAIKDRMGVKI